ncbi:hypothetical protein JTB14_014323 [Gonioctena quinquepunctata]|nr:hypothetical protein JTB14_014323 [Gonioctena quinquepunctata]
MVWRLVEHTDGQRTIGEASLRPSDFAILYILPVAFSKGDNQQSGPLPALAFCLFAYSSNLCEGLRRELCQKLKMDRKKYYDLENPRDIQEVMDLIENEDLSDIELGVGSDEKDLQEYEDEENDLRDNLDGSEGESGTANENTINSVEEDDMDAIEEASQQRQRGERNKKRIVQWKKKHHSEWKILNGPLYLQIQIPQSPNIL